MSPQVKAGLILGLIVAGAIIIATAMSTYFSPFQTCVRSSTSSFYNCEDCDPPTIYEEYLLVASCAGATRN